MINIILTLIGYQRVYDLYSFKEIVTDSSRYTIYYFVQTIWSLLSDSKDFQTEFETDTRFYVVVKYLNKLPHTIIVKATPSNIDRIIDRISVDDLCKTVFSDIMSIKIYYNDELIDDSAFCCDWSNICALNSQHAKIKNNDSWIEVALVYLLYRSGKIINTQNFSLKKLKYEICTLDDLINL